MLLSCDQGEPTDEASIRPPVGVIAWGSGPTHALPADGDFIVAFDRLLLPFSVTRQSISLRDGFNNPVSAPIVVYDPVARTVTLRNPTRSATWLVPHTPYRLVLGVPKDRTDLTGVRAIDGATLAAPRVLEFMAGAAQGVMPDPGVSFCSDVLEPILKPRCGGCHSVEGGARMGLLLTRGFDVGRTAIGLASKEMNRGPFAGTGSAPSPVFGVDMPIVDPGDPGNSYIMYKLLSFGESPSDVPADDLHTALSEDERVRLRSQIAGQPMPIGGPPVSYAELETLRWWIAYGAPTADCP